ncbi:DUF2798 domain-containing protein [Pectinatus frisingensis]|uniref:DUF2798 domain-containing protein n=1 Tax=Pectinatus frisingensis TaxID=865 RepID=UPI0015F46CE0|nr:DUF2798 domain-containing protein [Pectinatus frisingensis]
MPKTMSQKIIFSILMAIFMVYGMETYNKFISDQIVSYTLFIIPWRELFGLSLCVMVLQTFIGEPLATRLVFYIVNHKKNVPGLMINLFPFAMVACMCPMMSLVATLLFKSYSNNSIQFLTIWFETIIINLPMALIWQIFVAGPGVRFIFKKIFVNISVQHKI